MAELVKYWAGHVYGTNTGNLFIELDKAGPEVAGSFRFLDNRFGAVVYKIEGHFEDKLTLKGTPSQVQPEIQVGDLTAEAWLTQEGNLRGRWETTIGTGGTFEAFPHDLKTTIAKAGDLPEQLYSRTVTLGPLRLYADDVRQLIAYLREDFTSGRTVITYNSRGSAVSKYADDFLKEMDGLGDDLAYLKIHHQEHEAHGINKFVTVELNTFGMNEVRTQGVRESWVVGKAEAISTFLKRYQSVLVNTYKRFGLTLNQFIFVAMLIVIPGIASLRDRAIFGVAVFALLAGLQKLHATFIPNLSIMFGEQKPSILARTWPSILSWIAGIGAAVVAALIYRWLTGNDPPI